MTSQSLGFGATHTAAKVNTYQSYNIISSVQLSIFTGLSMGLELILLKRKVNSVNEDVKAFEKWMQFQQMSDDSEKEQTPHINRMNQACHSLLLNSKKLKEKREQLESNFADTLNDQLTKENVVDSIVKKMGLDIDLLISEILNNSDAEKIDQKIKVTLENWSPELKGAVATEIDSALIKLQDAQKNFLAFLNGVRDSKKNDMPDQLGNSQLENQQAKLEGEVEKYKQEIQRLKDSSLKILENQLKAHDNQTLAVTYRRHQQTLENDTKNVITKLIQRKHALEYKFLKSKLKQAKLQVNVATICLTVRIGIAITGLLFTPIGGSGIILFLLSSGSVTTKIGIFGANYLQSLKYKPRETRTVTHLFRLRLTYTKLRKSLADYSLQLNKRRLERTTTNLYDVAISLFRSKKINREEEDLKKFANIIKSQAKFEHWTKKLEKMQTHLKQERWKDFAEYTASSSDILDNLQKTLEIADFRLFSKETRELLEVQLGIDLNALQAQIQEEPSAIKETLQEFFTFDNAMLLAFILHQQKLREKHLL